MRRRVIFCFGKGIYRFKQAGMAVRTAALGQVWMTQIRRHWMREKRVVCVGQRNM